MYAGHIIVPEGQDINAIFAGVSLAGMFLNVSFVSLIDGKTSLDDLITLLNEYLSRHEFRD